MTAQQRTAAWAKAIAFGVVVAGAVGVLAGAVRGEDFWLTTGIFAFCALGPAIGFGVLAFLELGPDEDHPEQSIERRWLDMATSGAFFDVFFASSVALAAVSVFDLTVEGIEAPIGLEVLAMISPAARYLVISRRES